MTSTKKGIVLSCSCVLALAIASSGFSTASAEIALLVYPSSSATFRFDPARYELLTTGHPDFDPVYSVGSVVLWDKVEDRIPVEVYRAPSLSGFAQSPTGQNEFVTLHDEFDLYVDGFGPIPRTIGNVLIRFIPTPHHSQPQIEVDNSRVDRLTCRGHDIRVVTPLGNGFYSDAVQHHVRWSGSRAVRITAFSDKNNNGVFDGGPPRWSILAQDAAVPVETKTWGAVKSLFDN